MGIDAEDIGYRIDQSFGIRLEVADLQEVCDAHGRDCTAGMLHDIVCAKCEKLGVAIPTSSWTRIRLILAETLCVPVDSIRRDAWLIRDLGCD